MIRSSRDNSRPTPFRCNSWGNHMAEQPQSVPLPQRRRWCACFPPTLISMASALCALSLAMSMWIGNNAKAEDYEGLKIENKAYRRALLETTTKLVARMNNMESRLPATQPHR
jgi:hypothetical protein